MDVWAAEARTCTPALKRGHLTLADVDLTCGKRVTDAIRATATS
jgi:hypothetical protein